MIAAYVEFELPDPIRFERLAMAFGRLKQAKELNVWPEAGAWLELFDAAALATFSSPTDAERDESRGPDPAHETPWHFDSLIEAFRNADYHLLECRRISGRLGRLEFDPRAWPYGGTGCIRGLIEAFGGLVLSEWDG